MKRVLISGRWLSFTNMEECGAPEDVLLDNKEVEAVFRGGLFTAKIDGEIDCYLVPYWGESIVKEIE